MFIGYGLNKVVYKFYDPIIKKVVISCDDEFIEDQQLKDVVSANVSCESREE